MSRSELVQTFRRLAEEIAERDFSSLEESSPITDLGLDSLGTMELVGALEQEVDVEIPDEDLAKIHRISDLLAIVERLVASGGGAAAGEKE